MAFKGNKPATSIDYVIGKLAGDYQYQVAKFADDGAPLQVYRVMYNHETGRGRCDCPAGMYRGTGSGDKHVLMVKKWLETNKDS